MRISVKVKPNARENRIEKTGDKQFSLWVKARPEKGKANQEAIEVLAEYFGIAKSRIALFRGTSSKQKIFDVKTDG